METVGHCRQGSWFQQSTRNPRCLAQAHCVFKALPISKMDEASITQNPKHKTLNPKPSTLNPKSSSLNLDPSFRVSGFDDDGVQGFAGILGLGF